MSNSRKKSAFVPLSATAGTLLLASATLFSGAEGSDREGGKIPPPSLSAPKANVKLHYNRDIRPILAENCFACHGPDSAARKAGLRLDKFADATADRGGHAAIAAGKPEASSVIARITGKGPVMPPVETHKTLTPKQIATLTLWIKQGAEYEQHWSYLPPKRPALPKVKNTAWVRNPIDRFVLAKLEQNRLTPAPEADKRTLARRLSLDLTGLPPDPADVAAFVADTAPNAYEKLVDKFLASPQWGEHRGRYWLDAARYADTHGIHFDNYREMWSYRDWVINAFNSNMPFNEFTVEQLAGDLLPNPTMDQRVATGFNRCNITTNEGGAIDEEYKVLYTRDRTETASQVFLGMTAGCAVCHDHKFDPLSQREFYSLTAFFNNTTQAAMDGNIKDTPPTMPVPRMEDRTRFEAMKTELGDARKKVNIRREAAKDDFAKWLAAGDGKTVAASLPSDKLAFQASLSEGQGREIQAVWDDKTQKVSASAEPVWDAGKVADKAFQRKNNAVIELPTVGDREKDSPYTVAFWIKLAPGVNNGAVLARMDNQHDYRGWDIWLEGNKVATHIISKWPENALKVATREMLTPGKWQHVTVTYDGSAKAEGVHIYFDGNDKPWDAQANTLKDSIKTTVPFKIGQRHAGQGVADYSMQDLRLYAKALNGEETARLSAGTRAAYLMARGADKLNGEEKEELFGWWLPSQDSEYRQMKAKLAAVENEERTILSNGTIAYVSQEKSEEAMAFILNRGEYDKRKDQVKPATPAALPAFPSEFPRNRLGLANWLLLPNHPLTTRVTVNRFWQEVFGQGLVRTAGDFGIMGELPSHPELLDWLAVEFREKGWDVKRFFKMVVMSATYRQASVTTPEKRQKDPSNRLLSRGARFRMDAEMVRDYALASSGLMVKRIGGPSVKPYQPDGVWEAVAMIGSNTRDYKRDTGESLYRRSLYTFWKRAAPPASLDIFNAPAREVCTVRRERTNTPLQALVTLNDIQYVEAARNLAQKALKEGGSDWKARTDFLAQRLLARPFKPQEQQIVAKSLKDLGAFYRVHEKDAQTLITVGESKPDATMNPAELAAWTMLTNQLMNLDEVLNK